MARENTSQYAILGALSTRPMSGYEIRTEMQHTKYFWSESDGQIYPMLAKLLANKMVECEEFNEPGKRKKKIYSITTSGSKKLQTWLRVPARPAVIRHETLLKLFFGQSISASENKEHLQEIFFAAKKNQQLCQQYTEQIKLEGLDELDNALYYIVADYGLQITKMQQQWVESSLKLLDAQSSSKNKR